MISRRPLVQQNRGRIPTRGPSGFDYRDVPGLLADLTADAAIHASGTASALVDQWSTHDCTQSTPSAQPAYGLDWHDGTPALTFDGTDDYLASNTLAQVFVAGTDQPFTAFLVMELVAAGSSGDCYWACGSSTDTDPIVRLMEGGASTIQVFRRDDVGGTATSTSYTSFDTSPHVVTVRFDGTTNIIRVDGATVASNDQGTATGLITVDRFALGALLRNTVGNFANYRFKHFLPYTGALSVSDYSAIEDYLARYLP